MTEVQQDIMAGAGGVRDSGSPLTGLRRMRARGLRSQTLVRLRWLAIIGQSVAVITVSGLLDFDMPVTLCFLLIAASTVLNLLIANHYRTDTQLPEQPVLFILGFDILQIAGLLWLTGGLENPFAVLIAGPLVVGASLLPPRSIVVLGALACGSATILALEHLPIPWHPEAPFNLPQLYVVGTWLAILCTVAFTGLYVWRIADEAQTLGDALTATELVLARETHLSNLDGLAAAAAHELGTPLSTITLVVKEMQRDVPEGAAADDLKLLSEQVARCRAILRKIGSLGNDGETPFARQSLSELIKEAAAPHQEFGIDIDMELLGEPADEPVWRRSPGILYGLGNLIENAVDFARERVRITASWDENTVMVGVSDDGHGIPVDILPKLGQPYLSLRGDLADPARALDRKGLGLGVFIAKTLLERSGASIDIRNASAPASGARITMRWPRSAFGSASLK
ncbi:ActS/PrrB/RegB family redox-sensitive histidine kinase [Tepidamorphus sp. 3E244]|uniref:ActS/PrrB/RegB family redox-sensitive histidine kinase n=1 Tax=Tepidamorphus sp. 3E244 TaxID=3385498 RepID=UPI0038FD2932